MFSRTLLKLALMLVMLVCSILASVALSYYGWGLAALLSAAMACTCVVMIVRLFKYASRKVAFMFDAIENDDFTFRFTGDQNRSRSEYFLNHSLNRIKDLVLNARMEAREREKYFETILNQVNTGIVVVNSQGVVFMINSHARKLLGVVQLTHLRQLSVIADDLVSQFMTIESGESRMVKFYDEASMVSLNITCTFAELKGSKLKIIAITDIAGDMNIIQDESWQRMSRVLTHEIMNSLSPITSLSQAMLQSDDEQMTKKGLAIIHQTSSSLSRFVDNYRTMTRIPPPINEEVDMGGFVRHEAQIMGHDITVNVAASDCIVAIDQGQISQVIVNLIKNARQATENKPNARIWIDVARNAKGRLYVDVCNDGQQISDEVRENIFVPFFTTKKDGNGIGLSLSRQIMRLHQGSLTLYTRPFTKFRLQF